MSKVNNNLFLSLSIIAVLIVGGIGYYYNFYVSPSLAPGLQQGQVVDECKDICDKAKEKMEECLRMMDTCQEIYDSCQSILDDCRDLSGDDLAQCLDNLDRCMQNYASCRYDLDTCIFDSSKLWQQCHACRAKQNSGGNTR